MDVIGLKPFSDEALIDEEVRAERLFPAFSFAQAEICPSTLKDMGEWKEIDDTVLFGNRNALIVCLQSSIILAIGQHHALAISSCSTGIEDISQVIHTCLLVEFLYFRLTRKILSQLQEVLEIEGCRVMCTDAHAGIEDDDTFQRWTEGKDTVSFLARVIILLDLDDAAYVSVGFAKIGIAIVINSTNATIFLLHFPIILYSQ